MPLESIRCSECHGIKHLLWLTVQVTRFHLEWILSSQRTGWGSLSSHPPVCLCGHFRSSVSICASPFFLDRLINKDILLTSHLFLVYYTNKDKLGLTWPWYMTFKFITQGITVTISLFCCSWRRLYRWSFISEQLTHFIMAKVIQLLRPTSLFRWLKQSVTWRTLQSALTTLHHRERLASS